MVGPSLVSWPLGTVPLQDRERGACPARLQHPSAVGLRAAPSAPGHPRGYRRWEVWGGARKGLCGEAWSLASAPALAGCCWADFRECWSRHLAAQEAQEQSLSAEPCRNASVCQNLRGCPAAYCSGGEEVRESDCISSLQLPEKFVVIH